MTHDPITLGDKLAPAEPKKPRLSFAVWLRNAAYGLLNFALLASIVALPSWWLLWRPDMGRDVMLGFLVVLLVLWLLLYLRRRGIKPRMRKASKTHSLLANDRQGFMCDLRLSAKTVIIDGSNIYHFGHENGLDAQPLGAIAHQLRAEGYRVVCFFDANIFYTLNGHGAFPGGQKHSVAMLEDIFGLTRDEIYVVPGGTQADKYILDCLKHLPISFAVSNDQFRDYAKKYPTVMKGDQWRKGVMISKGELKLRQHRFKSPVLLS